MPQFRAVLELLLGSGWDFGAQAAISFVCLLQILEASLSYCSLEAQV